jgi:glutamine synthetase
MARPDLTSFTPVPWQPDLARFACNIYVEGEEWPYDARTILRHRLERAQSKGYVLKMGMELEFFLVRQQDDGSIVIADPLDTLEKPRYVTRNSDFLSTTFRLALPRHRPLAVWLSASVQGRRPRSSDHRGHP